MIESLVWYPANVAKLREHGLSREAVEDLVLRDAYLVTRHPAYPDQVRITGPTSRGWWLTVALEEWGGGVYRPVTGWAATASERRRYEDELPGGAGVAEA